MMDSLFQESFSPLIPDYRRYQVSHPVINPPYPG